MMWDMIYLTCLYEGFRGLGCDKIKYNIVRKRMYILLKGFLMRTIQNPKINRTVSYNYSIHFNSNTLFKDGDPVSLKPIFPGAIQTCEQYNICFRQIYKTTQVHRTNTGTHNLHFHTTPQPINTHT